MTDKKYDLGDRTFKFSQELLSFCSRVPKNQINETKYWLRLVAEIVPGDKEILRKLFREVQELNLIFAAIIRKGRGNLDNEKTNA
ncbi:MAG: hypothetical protein Q8Q92_02180 [bacterium]|nr:hypothetical protein [bacterium]